MTGFELWQAGEGPEPVVVPKLPAQLAFMPPWRWRHLRHRERRPGTWAPGQLTELLATVRREEAEAAEEQRAALAHAVRDLSYLVGRPPLPDEFRCYICGVECDTKPDAGLSVCEEHCPDHDYTYDPDERRKACRHCGQPMPLDWYDCE